MKFIHLSDPHLLAGPHLIYGVDTHARLRAAVHSIRANVPDADLCMVTGDLTDRGDAASYRAVEEILGQLPCPWHPLIGNHDDRAVALSVLENLPEHQDGFLQYQLETEAGLFIALDTVLGRGGGILCEARLNWLVGCLQAAENAGRDVFLFMHHVPFDIGIAWLDGIGLENGKDLAALLKPFSHIRHLFMGHVHRPCHGSWHGIPFSTVRSTAHQVALRLGDAEPQFIDETPTYAVVLVNADHVVVHDHSFLEETRPRHSHS